MFRPVLFLILMTLNAVSQASDEYIDEWQPVSDWDEQANDDLDSADDENLPYYPGFPSRQEEWEESSGEIDNDSPYYPYESIEDDSEYDDPVLDEAYEDELFE